MRPTALVTTLLLLLSAMASAAPAKVSKDLQKLQKNGTAPVDVIVQYAQAPTEVEHAKAAEHGAALKKQLGHFKGAVYTVPANEIGALANDPNVKFVSLDRPLAATATTYTDAFYAVNADLAQSYRYDGSGIGVAVIDSGINAKAADLSRRVVYQQDFTGEGIGDNYGHGTHVAGLIGGNGSKSKGPGTFLTFMGIAPKVNLIDLKVLNSQGHGTDSAVIAAIQTAIALKDTYNIRIINLSLGRGIFESYRTDPLTQAVEQAWKAGIFVVVAAGNYGRDDSSNNNGYGTITSPGNDPYVLTVGAMNTEGTPTAVDDGIASYSSKGPSMLDHVVKPDLVAPGNRVDSVLASNSVTLAGIPSTHLFVHTYQKGPGNPVSRDYFTLSGTSMATPIVSGAAALLLQKYPSLTPDQLKALLMKTAFKNLPLYTTATDTTTGTVYNEQADIFTVGAGELDIAAALNDETDLSGIGTGSARSPLAYYDAETGQTTLVTGYSVVWGSSVTWGSSVIWGSSIVWGSSVIWGSNATGQSVIWGSSVVWGSSTNTGFSVIWGSSTSPMSVVWGASNNGSDATAVLVGGDR